MAVIAIIHCHLIMITSLFLFKYLDHIVVPHIIIERITFMYGERII